MSSPSPEPLTIAQVSPHRRTTRKPVNEYVASLSQELARRGHEVVRIGSGEPVKRPLNARPYDIVHVHEPFAPSVSAAALRHSLALNVATFHAPQERVLSTSVARPLVEIFFGRIDARTVTSAATGELLRKYFPASYELIEPGRDWGAIADDFEAVYRRLLARRHDPTGDPELRATLAKRPLIEVDLHMHTDHSGDCATPVEVLLQTARDRGLGAIAVTDHNEVSGALEAAEIAAGMDGLKVIVGEEIKTAEQGEVIGLFLKEKIPKGLTMAESVAAIREQGGLVYVPHPFDRFHSVPDYEHLLDMVEEVDLLEVFNPRVALTALQRGGGAVRGQVPDRPGRRVGLPRRPGAGERAPADPRFRRAGGVPRGDARRRHHPQAQESGLRPDAEVPADDGAAEGAETARGQPETGARGAAAAGRRRARAGRQELMHGSRREGGAPTSSKMSGQMHSTDDEIREKYLERAIRELNQMSREILDCPYCPRGKLMPVLGSGHPQADVMMLKHSPMSAEIEEGVAFYGRSGNALMKSFKRLGIDPLAVYGTLCVKCPVAEPDLAPQECVARLVEEIAIVQPKIVVVMGEPSLRILNGLHVPLSREIEQREGEIQAFTPTIDALYVPDIDDSLDEEGAKQRFWRAFRMLGTWYEDLPPY